MKRAGIIKIINQSGIIAILRAEVSDQLIVAVDAIRKGGVKVIEITMNTPGSLTVIAEVKQKFESEIIFGAGTVLDTETGRAAILAGADFIVSPILNIELIKLCNRYSVPVIPGCFTSSEVISGWEAGADFIKLFPASNGGPNLVKAILAPLPQVRIIPVGGVNLDNASEYFQAGAFALGVGSSLVNNQLLKEENWDELTQRAASFIQEVKKGRSV